MLYIYNNILYYSNLQNISIRELEMKAGLANGSIRKWNDIDPGISKVKAVSEQLQVPIKNLMYGPDQNILKENRFTLDEYGNLNIKNFGEWDFNYSGFEANQNYDYGRFIYGFYSIDGEYIFPNTVFVFEKFINLNRYNVVINDYSLNNKIVIVSNKINNNKFYYIGYLKCIVGLAYPIFISLNPIQYNLNLSNFNVQLESICKLIVKHV